MSKKYLLAVYVLLQFFVLSAYAAVSSEQAMKLGNSLTFVGAEQQGNGKEIPAWNGGLTITPAGYQQGDHHISPFADDEILFIITSENYLQHQQRLTAGQIAMLQQYPDSYFMQVYSTRRTAALPGKIYQSAKNNATQVSLVGDGNGLTEFSNAIPFPIPQNGLEVIWNHITRYRGETVHRIVNQVVPQVNGKYSLVKFSDEMAFNRAINDEASIDDNLLHYYKQRVLSPSRLAGEVLLVHETLDQVKEPRRAWIYNAGQRRVRRAPQVAYDGPGTASDGMRTVDNFDMYNGSPDRYNWKIIEKKEVYIPYNSYALHSSELKYSDILTPLHMNPEYSRYELHRVWHVRATLKEGQRHIYAQRDFYIDEDSWQISIVDHYDGHGELWRVAEAFMLQYYDADVPWITAETLTDLRQRRYLVFGLDNEEKTTFQFNVKRSKSDYTPAALQREGLR